MSRPIPGLEALATTRQCACCRLHWPRVCMPPWRTVCRVCKAGHGSPHAALISVTIRYTHGWSQDELARRAGVHRNSVANCEAGVYAPSDDTFKALIVAHELALRVRTSGAELQETPRACA